MSRAEIQCQCTRCRFKHLESERVEKKRTDGVATDGITVTELLCPKCSCRNFYDLTPQVAWCWASGLIESGDVMPEANQDGGGAIQVATGPKAFLKGVLSVLGRHGMGSSDGRLLVPGVPEAEGPKAALAALDAWVAWAAKGNGKKYRYGVVFGGAA